MKEYILDTNYILRYILNDVKKQADIVEKYLLQAKEDLISIHITILVMYETFFALFKFYKFSKLEIFQKLSILLDADYLDIEKRNIFKEALNIYTIKNISLVDSILLVESHLTNRELLTFDKKLRKMKI